MRCVFWLACFILLAAVARAGYDPLKVPDSPVVSKLFEVKDASRGRGIPLRVYLPGSGKPAPVILFSHGLGGSRDNNPYLGEHWAKRGYAVVFIQHPGSDEGVWKNSAPMQRMASMRRAASGGNLMLRGGDVPVVLDKLAVWNAETGHELNGRLDLKKIGMSGHSFGAVTTQAVAGQAIAGGRVSLLEPRIRAAVMMSPSPPVAGDPAKAFGPVRIPCLLMTGTLDDSPIGNTTPEDRLQVFPYLKQAPAWQVVFDGAEHMSFGDRGPAGSKGKGNRYHRPILALSTAFWDAQLNGNQDALTWLNGKEARAVLSPGDKWDLKTRELPVDFPKSGE